MSTQDCIQTGDGDDLGDLLERLRPKLRSILFRFRIPEQDAEDLIQETLLSLVCREEALESPDAWMIAGLRYRCLMYWRSRRRCLYRTVDQTLLEVLAQPEPSSADRFDIVHDVQKVLPQIPQRCRSVIELRYRQGMRPKEVAQELGYQNSSIATITKRCLAALSRKLLGVGYARESQA